MSSKACHAHVCIFGWRDPAALCASFGGVSQCSRTRLLKCYWRISSTFIHARAGWLQCGGILDPWRSVLDLVQISQKRLSHPLLCNHFLSQTLQIISTPEKITDYIESCSMGDVPVIPGFARNAWPGSAIIGALESHNVQGGASPGFLLLR